MGKRANLYAGFPGKTLRILGKMCRIPLENFFWGISQGSTFSYRRKYEGTVKESTREVIEAVIASLDKPGTKIIDDVRNRTAVIALRATLVDESDTKVGLYLTEEQWRILVDAARLGVGAMKGVNLQEARAVVEEVIDSLY